MSDSDQGAGPSTQKVTKKRKTYVRQEEVGELESRLDFLESLLVRNHCALEAHRESTYQSPLPSTLNPSTTQLRELLSTTSDLPHPLGEENSSIPDITNTNPLALTTWYLKEQKRLSQIGGGGMENTPQRGTEASSSDYSRAPGRKQQRAPTSQFTDPSPLSQAQTSQNGNVAEPISKKQGFKRRKSTSPGPDEAGDERRNAESDVMDSYPRAVVDQIVMLYMDLIHPHLPVLHARGFCEGIGMNLPSSTSSEINPSESLPRPKGIDRRRYSPILHAIVASMCRLEELDANSPWILQAGGVEAIWLRAYNATLVEALIRPSLEALQALVIIAFTALTSSWKDLRGYNLVGLAARICVLIGVNREHGVIEIENESNSDGADLRPVSLPSHFLQPPKNAIDSEVRRRVFWSIFLLDRVGAPATGWTFSINRRDLGVDLPGPDNWDAIVPADTISELGISPSDGLSARTEEVEPTSGRRKPLQRSPFKFIPAESVIEEIEAPNPEFRFVPAAALRPDEDEEIGAQSPFALLVEACEAMGQAHVYTSQPLRPATSDAQLEALVDLDLRIERWYSHIPSKYRLNRPMRPGFAPFPPKINLMHAMHQVVVVSMLQTLAYRPPSFLKRGHPNAIGRCRDVFSANAALLRRLAPEQLRRQSPLFGFCIFMISRSMCMHCYSVMDGGQMTRISGPDAGIVDEILAKARDLRVLGQVWQSCLPLAGLLEKAVDHLYGRAVIDESFFNPRISPLSPTIVELMV